MTLPLVQTCTVLSRTARRVAVSQGPRLRVYDVHGDRPRLRYAAEATAPVRAFSFSSDGELLLTGAEDGTVAVWEVTRAAKPTYTFRSHRAPSQAVTWSDSEGLFASGSEDGSIVVYGVDGERRQRYEDGAVIRSVTLTLGACVVTGDEDGQVQLWTPFDDEPVTRRAFPNPLLHVTVSPDERTHAAVEADGTLTVWRSHETVGSQRYPVPPTALHFRPGQPEQLGVASGRRVDVYWVTGELQHSRRFDVPFSVLDFAWTSSGELVALGTEGGRLLLHRGDATVSLPAEVELPGA